jgi:hypothetical protein
MAPPSVVFLWRLRHNSVVHKLCASSPSRPRALNRRYTFCRKCPRLGHSFRIGGPTKKVRSGACRATRIRASGFSSNCFRKIEARATMASIMTPQFQSSQSPGRAAAPINRVAIVRHHHGLHAGEWRQKKKWPRGSAQPFEKARFEQENPRKSKSIPLIFFARPWPGFAGF